MSFSIDNHNGLVRWIIIMSFGNKYYECCDINNDHDFLLYKFHGFMVWNKGMSWF